MNLLFVCSENRLRSPTGEEVFSKYEGINAIGAGTNSDEDIGVKSCNRAPSLTRHYARPRTAMRFCRVSEALERPYGYIRISFE